MASSLFRLGVVMPRIAGRALFIKKELGLASVKKMPDFGVLSRLMSAQKAMVSVTFIKPDGTKVTGQGKEGDSLLDVVVNNDLDLDGFGACEGTLACSTCHLIFKKEDFQKLPDTPSDEELDMLDLAYGLCETSRLGCQVVLAKWMDGMVVTVPAATMDARER